MKLSSVLIVVTAMCCSFLLINGCGMSKKKQDEIAAMPVTESNVKIIFEGGKCDTMHFSYKGELKIKDKNLVAYIGSDDVCSCSDSNVLLARNVNAFSIVPDNSDK